MTKGLEGLHQNSDGLYEYVESPARHREGQSRAPGAVAIVALVFIVLLLITVFAFVYGFGRGMADEFCESEPGGRGYSGEKAPEEASAFCDRARNG
jgi:hypothetical protein